MLGSPNTSSSPPSTVLSTLLTVLELPTQPPISSLCHELYATIFLLARPEDARAHSAFVSTLLLVSKRWNACALGLSRLWTTITIDSKSHVGEVLASHLRTSLRRAGNHFPLTLMLRNCEINKGRLDQILELLGKESSRVKEIVMSADALMHADGHITNWNLPALGSISLYNGRLQSKPLFPHQCAPFSEGTTSTITRLAIADHRRPFDYESLHFPTESLETFEFTFGPCRRRGDFRRLATLVAKCHKLWYLALTGRAYVPWKGKISSTSLRYLSLDLAGQTLDSVPIDSVPNLTHLRIIGGPDSWTRGGLQWPLMQRLEVLDAVGTYAQNPPVWVTKWITRMTPNLRELRVPLYTLLSIFPSLAGMGGMESLKLLQVFDNLAPLNSPDSVDRGQGRVDTFASEWPNLRVEWHAGVHDLALAYFDKKKPVSMKVVVHECTAEELGGWPFRTLADVEDSIVLEGTETPEA